MNGAKLAAALRNGTRVYGTCVVSTSPKWPAMIAGLGLDFVFLDTEHMPLEREQLAWMCQAFSALNLAPIVRIPEPDPYRACMALDGGAEGIIAPYVESVDQVRALRGAVKFRPLKGKRLYNILEGKEEPEPELAAYLQGRNAGKVMIVNVESVPALEALDDILAVPDVDALLVGPHDLSLNLGIPEQYDHPRFNQAVSTIIRKARSKNVGVGIHYSFGIEKEIGWGKEGANLILHSSDYFLVKEALENDLRKFRQAFGERKSVPETSSSSNSVVI
jgi:2-keto-3-deoxy-L-rhamnonate aldolase RhmA